MIDVCEVRYLCVLLCRILQRAALVLLSHALWVCNLVELLSEDAAASVVLEVLVAELSVGNLLHVNVPIHLQIN